MLGTYILVHDRIRSLKLFKSMAHLILVSSDDQGGIRVGEFLN